MSKWITIITIIFSLQLSLAFSQNYPSNYFRSPLDIPLFLSGTFGELRANHFHSGIDIKTQGVQGKKVYAVADGYISRINVSTSGYGKAIYITHPNGYVSVYGHLRNFNDSLQKMVMALQYKRKSYTMETYPKAGSLKVEKGEVIAYSGNTGGSNGPHLHFEIREEASQYPVNPLLFKSIKIKDFTRPTISGIAIYPADEFSSINGKNDTLYFKVEGWGLKHRIKGNPTFKVKGRVSFGIKCYDKMNETKNHNGIYDLSLKIDSANVFGLRMNRLSFSTTRYINSLIDYKFYINNSSKYIRTCIDTNNRLFVYGEVKDNGIYTFDDSLSHQLEFDVKDAYGNLSNLKFKVNPGDSLQEPSVIKPIGESLVFSRPYQINSKNIMVKFSANTFYRSLSFDFDSLPERGDYSAVYKLHENTVAVQKYFRISIKPDSVSSDLRNKLYVAYSPDAKEYWYAGNMYSTDFVSAKARLLGYYTLMADIISPEIMAINIGQGKNIAKQHTIKMTIDERETEIKSYNGYLNGKWILMEYNAKKKLLVYNFDKHLLKGKNIFRLVVVDKLNNRSEYKADLIY